jgi:alkylation response protein AidB-like acyl-CoA dehydrogenase
MNFDFSDAQKMLKTQARDFLKSSCPTTVPRRILDGDEPYAAELWKGIVDLEWTGISIPEQYGGIGYGYLELCCVAEELGRAVAPVPFSSSVYLATEAILAAGSEEQKKKYLPDILSGAKAYAQGYSEPGSGSDLASLQTRAVRDGDEYVINGQKIWTSGAHHADALFALTRTDPDAPKHRGITFLVIDDIKTPGLTIRPLINMAWKHGFNETFFEDVRVPVANVIGEENRGWYVGATLLDFERSNISGAVAQKRTINSLLAYTKSEDGKSKSKLSGRGGESTALRNEVAERFIETGVGENFSFRIISMQNRGLIPNYEASTAKMFISEAGQRLQRTGTKLFGLYSNIWEPTDRYAPAKSAFTQGYVTSVPATIAAGSSEIQRNIIATRGLGLPRG